MKQLMVLLGCVFLLFGGCQEASRSKSGVEVTVEGSSEFPSFLAGAWEANKNELDYWQIVFEPDGTISSAVVPLGEAEIKPNRRTKFSGPTGKPGFFETGDFQVSYDPQSRELSANIKVKQFYLDMGARGALKGSWEYLITGVVSSDGKTWEGDVFNATDIVALVPDPNSPEDNPQLEDGPKLRLGLGEEEEERLIFTKVSDINTGQH